MAAPEATSMLPSVCFAPDYRQGNPYQSLLASALEELDTKVQFLSDYYRLLPLARGVARTGSSLLHLHWPEAYFPQARWWHQFARQLRYPLDLALTTRQRPLVVTAHNLVPHSHANELLVRGLIKHTYHRANAIIAHGQNSAAKLAASFKLPDDRITIIPHGDLAAALPPPVAVKEARKLLGLRADTELCLMFGAIADYKGIEEVIAHWKAAQPAATLVIVGNSRSPSYAGQLAALIGDNTDSIMLLPGWLDNGQLAIWLSAADCAMFNYRRIFVSGAACLARSWGLPLLLPERLKTLDLDEPSEHVLRFDTLAGNFSSRVDEACRLGRDYEAAADWRANTAWQKVAALTIQVYRRLLD